MNSNDLLIAYAFGILVWIIIIYNIIASATKATKIEKHLRTQRDLLAEIALSSGVAIERVDEIFEKNK